jgi:hypothetical protein
MFFYSHSRLRMPYTLPLQSYLMYVPVIPSRIFDSYDIHVLQAAKGMNTNCDALVDMLESIERFLMRLDIYTHTPRTPALDEMVVKIIVELLSTLALVTKGLKQGRMSKLPHSMQHRKVCKGAVWRE